MSRNLVGPDSGTYPLQLKGPLELPVGATLGDRTSILPGLGPEFRTGWSGTVVGGYIGYTFRSRSPDPRHQTRRTETGVTLLSRTGVSPPVPDHWASCFGGAFTPPEGRVRGRKTSEPCPDPGTLDEGRKTLGSESFIRKLSGSVRVLIVYC